MEKSGKNTNHFAILQEDMEEEEAVETKKLSEVVKECHSRWFQETLKEAEAGNVKMQLVLSQMYFNGYGVSKDSESGKYWMKRASKYIHSSEVNYEKRPGYGTTDTDSDLPTSSS